MDVMTAEPKIASRSIVNLPPDWRALLGQEFEKSYMIALQDFLKEEKQQGKSIYPPDDLIFSAFAATPVAEVKVVVLGQDPYHGDGQACGKSFSVPMGVRPPPSLKNIFKELHQDVGFQIPDHGCLDSWAYRGVLLLNSVLTVEQGQAASHRICGWEEFTDKVIEVINDTCEHVVFLLWGSYAKKKAVGVCRERHLVLHAPHPSPLSAHRGFLGCKHFSLANTYLQKHGRGIIDWCLSERIH